MFILAAIFCSSFPYLPFPPYTHQRCPFRCASASVGEGHGPVLSPGSVEPEREAGPAAMGHPSWGSGHGLYEGDVGEGERLPVPP